MKPPGYQRGDWSATCYQCGRRFLASRLIRHWQGFYVCRQCHEPRHPQDFVKAVKEVQTVPFAQPQWRDSDITIYVCDINGRSAYPGRGMPGCMMPGNDITNPEVEGPEPIVCDIYAVQGIPGWAGPGCAIPGYDPMVA